MKNIIFLAPPAAGKGTISSALSEKYGYIHVSTGNLLRNVKEKNLASRISSLLKTGNLLPNEIIYEILDNYIKEIKDKPFVLDGFPRSIKQVKHLNELINDLKLPECVVIYLDIDYEKAMTRALGRMICPQCGRNYNKFIETTKPKVAYKCDICKIDLVTRSDDTEETFKIRYNEYLKETYKVVEYYKEKGLLYTIKSVDDLQSMIDKIIKIVEV